MLADSFNKMAESLDEFEQNRRSFVANVSHDFRSPLTSIQGYLRAMIDGVIPPENQNKYNNTPGIFTQEVASTANEIMFHKYMIDNAKSKDEKLYWLDSEINLFLNTIMRQCLYSEFEDYCYKTIEKEKKENSKSIDESLIFTMITMYINTLLLSLMQLPYANRWRKRTRER